MKMPGGEQYTSPPWHLLDDHNEAGVLTDISYC